MSVKNPRKPDFTVEYLRSILDYNPDTGELTWRSRADASKGWNIKHVGKRAGARGSHCMLIGINGVRWGVHRLIVYWMTGEFPEAEVDHRDLDGFNNKWTNLRVATTRQNVINRRRFASKKHPLKGAYQDKRWGRWNSCIRKDGKLIWLGSFPTPEQAHTVYCEAAYRLFGEFARTE